MTLVKHRARLLLRCRFMPAPMIDPAELGALLREYRLHRGFSRQVAATRAELDPSYLSLVERGLRKPTVDAVTRLLRVYGVSWVEMGAKLDEVLR